MDRTRVKGGITLCCGVVLFAATLAGRAGWAKSAVAASPAPAGHAAHPAAMGAMKHSGMNGMKSGMNGMKHSGKAAMKSGMMSVTGPVKGSVTGHTFVIARKGGPVTVDATGAKVRENGRFGSLSAVKGGVMVTAKGAMMGTTLKATEVDVHARGGKKGPMGKTPPKAPAMMRGKKPMMNGGAPPKPPMPPK